MEIDNNEKPIRMFKILYPDVRMISETEIMQWARDKWANNANWFRCCACGLDCRNVDTNCQHMADYEPMYNNPENNPPISDLFDAIEYLQELGVATFARF